MAVIHSDEVSPSPRSGSAATYLKICPAIAIMKARPGLKSPEKQIFPGSPPFGGDP